MYIETEVNADDILKLEKEERESILDDNSSEVSEDEISDEEEYQRDEEPELTSQIDEEKGSTENITDVGAEETNRNGEENVEQKIKTIKKPKKAEYKVIR